MQLKCNIKGKEYDLVQGANFSEEYNETLDSGTIILDHINAIPDLKPYDDVFIYDAGNKPKNQFSNRMQQLRVDITKISENAQNGFKIVIYSDNGFNFDYSPKVYIKFGVIQLEGTEDDYYEQWYDTEERYTMFSNDYMLRQQEHLSGGISVRENFQFTLNADGNLECKYFAKNPTLTTAEIVDIKSIRFFYFTNYEAEQEPTFYKHLLVDQFTAERLNLNADLYKYKIELFSETKGLETVQLPNLSITQPLDKSKKRSIASYLTQYVEMYSPKVKVVTNEDLKYWAYRNKYEMSSEALQYFQDSYSPDFTLNNPNLKDILTQLMLVKDRIPKVVDGRIYAYDITQRNGVFNKEGTNYYVKSRSSSNHCSNLKRTYSNALSQQNTCKRVEYLGFRNSDEAMLTIDNMRLETNFPIYKIDKIYCCYYKRGKVQRVGDDPNGSPFTEKAFLCKQDITPLIKLNSERNLLKSDWNEFENTPPTTIDELSKYKLCTLGYDIGSKAITGWGATYTYPKGWWANSVTKTYFENIITTMNKIYPFGIYDYGFINKQLDLYLDYTFIPYEDLSELFVNPFSNASLGMKSFFFEVEYDAFYNGTIIHSKDSMNDDITINDNSSSSLTLLENDGLFEKEKVNRFGNEAIQINARYTDTGQIQALGSVFDDDVIIYHRDYSIYNNVINCTYYATKDYVLKNYFTSVYAKHRTYNLMSYGESVLRSENKKLTMLLSKDKKYLELENLGFSFGDDRAKITKILSFIKPTSHAISTNYILYDDKINYGFMFYDNKLYALDVNAFSSGYSMCFNVQMKDNVSAGTYLDPNNLEPSGNWTDYKDALKGTIQKWYLVTDSVKTGFAEKIGFYVAHIDLGQLFKDGLVLDGNDFDYIKNELFPRLFKLPLIDSTGLSNLIGGTYKMHKDNKEVIDMTYQIEPIATDENVIFSQWMMKLSDLLANYQKVQETYDVESVNSYNLEYTLLATTYDYVNVNIPKGYYYPYIQIKMKNVDVNKLSNGALFQGSVYFPDYNHYNWDGIIPVFKAFKFEFKFISDLTTNGFSMHGVQRLKLDANFLKPDYFTDTDAEIYFWKVKQDPTYTYFSNIKFGNTREFDKPEKRSDIYFTNKKGNRTLASYDLFRTGGYGYFTLTNFNRCEGQEPLLDNSSIIEPTSVGTFHPRFSVAGETTTITYYKNIFLRFGSEPIKKTIVYDELSELNDNNYKVEDVFKFNADNNIVVDLTHLHHSVKSVQIWFFDNGSYKFVFGVNTTPEDFEKGQIIIYTSLLSKYNNKVYNDKNQEVGTLENYATSTKDKEHQYYEVKANE